VAHVRAAAQSQIRGGRRSPHGEGINEQVVGNVVEGNHDSFVSEVFPTSPCATGCPGSDESKGDIAANHGQRRGRQAPAECVSRAN
jgi:hypothetical protein